MFTICFTDNEEVIATAKAGTMDDAIESIRTDIGGMSEVAEDILRNGGEIFFGDCESVYVTKN